MLDRVDFSNIAIYFNIIHSSSCECGRHMIISHRDDHWPPPQQSSPTGNQDKFSFSVVILTFDLSYVCVRCLLCSAANLNVTFDTCMHSFAFADLQLDLFPHLTGIISCLQLSFHTDCEHHNKVIRPLPPTETRCFVCTWRQHYFIDSISHIFLPIVLIIACASWAR